MFLLNSANSVTKQECIPVGCVPAARRPYAGVCFRGGVWSGGCLLWGGVSAPGGSALGGCLLQGGCLVQGGLLLGGLLPGEGGGIPACTEADPLLPP